MDERPDDDIGITPRCKEPGSTDDHRTPPVPRRSSEVSTDSPSEVATESDPVCHSLTDDVSASERPPLLVYHKLTPTHSMETAPPPPESPAGEKSLQKARALRESPDRTLPIHTSPTRSAGRPGPLFLQSTTCEGHSYPDKVYRSSTSTSKKQHKPKTVPAQVAGDDHCALCMLACLFCELLPLCSLLVQFMACGRSCGRSSGAGASEAVACGEDPCSGLDCGKLKDCCEFSSCLELCMECCAICFPV